MADLNIDIARLQKEIADRLGLQSSQVVFDFSLNEGVTKLDLITISQRHEQSFLYHTTKAIDKKEALEKMKKQINVLFILLISSITVAQEQQRAEALLDEVSENLAQFNNITKMRVSNLLEVKNFMMLML